MKHEPWTPDTLQENVRRPIWRHMATGSYCGAARCATASTASAVEFVRDARVRRRRGDEEAGQCGQRGDGPAQDVFSLGVSPGLVRTRPSDTAVRARIGRAATGDTPGESAPPGMGSAASVEDLV